MTLTERVTRTIYKIDDTEAGYEGFETISYTHAARLAEAVITIVLEEAAKVAKAHKKARHLHYGVGNQSALLAADTIYAGILALGDKP